MPRKRIYATNAERQYAYDERKRQKKREEEQRQHEEQQRIENLRRSAQIHAGKMIEETAVSQAYPIVGYPDNFDKERYPEAIEMLKEIGRKLQRGYY